MSVQVPPGLFEFGYRGEDWQSWLAALPGLVESVLVDWALTPDGPGRSGYCAMVLPVVESDGRRSALKVGWPHDETTHQQLALERLRGDGMPLLYRADPIRHITLMERLDAARDLRSVEVVEACRIIAGFYRRIHVPPPAELRPLTSYVELWTDQLADLDVAAPIDSALRAKAISLARDFVASATDDHVMIHGDLHYENVLAAEREPWLVIDPEPMAGDAAYEVAPLLWNRWGEAVATGDAKQATRARLDAVVEVSGLDAARVRAWVVVRMMHNALWAVQDYPAGLNDEARDWIALCHTLAEAVDD